MNNILSIDPATNNLALVNLNVLEGSKVKINHSNLINLKEGLKKTAKFEEVVDKLIQNLNGQNINNIDIVLIENPPSLKNPALKSIALIIYTYFKLKGCKVCLVSPSRKLSKEDNKKSYKERKEKSIEDVLKILDDVDKNELSRYEKKDDICDCILQAVAYYNKNKPKNKDIRVEPKPKTETTEEIKN